MKPLSVTVNGEKHEFDLDEFLEIVDINNDMNMVATLMGFWATLSAAAEAEKIRTDSFYRNWRAKVGKALLEGDPKLAEWKVRQIIESEKEFGALKESLARATHNVVVTRGIYESIKTKASMLQSKGAMMRAELDSTSMRTPKEPTTSAPKIRSKKAVEKAEEKELEREDKVSAMKRLKMGKKKSS